MFKLVLYGDGDASGNRGVHRWVVQAYSKHTGDLIWERVAYEGTPNEKCHMKSTYASPTPATDGRWLTWSMRSPAVRHVDSGVGLRSTPIRRTPWPAPTRCRSWWR